MKRLILLFLLINMQTKYICAIDDSSMLLVNKTGKTVICYITKSGKTDTLEIEPGKELAIKKIQKLCGLLSRFPYIEVEPNSEVFAITSTPQKVDSLSEWRNSPVDGSGFSTIHKKRALRLQTFYNEGARVVTFHDEPYED